MTQEIVTLNGFTLEGIFCRTCNGDEMNPSTAKIGKTVQRFFQEGFMEKIKHPKEPGVIYGAYTDYESDNTGAYTYFIGEEVFPESELSAGLSRLVIPDQRYSVFTNGPGVMPDVCVELWQKVWTLTPQELGGSRSYGTDVEFYQGADEEAAVTLYIAINE